MKNLLTISLLTLYSLSYAQTNDPVAYIDAFYADLTELQQLQIEYYKLAVDGNANDFRNKRQGIQAHLQQALSAAKQQPTYEGDKKGRLKSEAVKLYEAILRTYEVDLEDLVAKKATCVECFETVLLRHDIINSESKEVDKLQAHFDEEIERFAKANDITLQNVESSDTRLIGRINKLTRYLTQLNLALAQVQYANNDVIEILNSRDPSKLKREINKLNKATVKALKRLEKTTVFEREGLVMSKTRNYITFLKRASEDKGTYFQLLELLDKEGNIPNNKVNLFNRKIQTLNTKATQLVQTAQQSSQELQRKIIHNL